MKLVFHPRFTTPRFQSIYSAIVVCAGLLLCLTPAAFAADAGLAFAYGGASDSIEAFDEAGETIHGIEISPHGLARFDRNGALLTQGGHFTADHAGGLWARGLASPRGFTIELVATPAIVSEQSGPILRLESSDQKPILEISQSGSELFTKVLGSSSPTPVRISIGTLAAGKQFFAAIVFDGKALRGYLNGVASKPVDIPLPANGSDEVELLLGGAAKSDPQWSGAIQRVALYRQPMDAGAITTHSTSLLTEQARAAAQLVVDVTLVNKSRVPTLAELAPYTQSLAVYEYSVENVRAGKYDDKKLYVVHWTVLDNTRLPFADVAPGQRYSLLLEPFDDQPQLQSENLSDSAVEDFTLPWFYDAGGTSLGFDITAEIASALTKNAPTITTSEAGSARLSVSRPPLTEAMRDARTRDIQTAKRLLAEELARVGGYGEWKTALIPFHADLRESAGKHTRYTIVGLENHLFSRSGVDYLLDADLLQTPNDSSAVRPFEVIVEFSRQLQSQGIDLIFVPVPCREEVYPDKLSSAAPMYNLVSPQLTQFLNALLEADVEVVDLRADFQNQRAKDTELLYPISEVHWGTNAVRCAAAEIARRLRRYHFEESTPPIQYSEKHLTLINQGNLVSSLPDDEKADYPAFEQDVVQVLNPDGTAYKDVENSPVLVMGDSFTMWFEKQSGTLSAHLAKELHIGVSNLPSKGGGPKVPRVAAEKGADFLAPRRVLVWVMVSRYLADSYAREWETPPPLAKF